MEIESPMSSTRGKPATSPIGAIGLGRLGLVFCAWPSAGSASNVANNSGINLVFILV